MKPAVNPANNRYATLPATGMKILAVEDDELSMRFLEAQIAEQGHDIVRARNGREALAEMERHKGRIDVVLMDREMPEMDGMTAARHIKDRAEWRHIPVVMVTGADSALEMKEGLDAGVFYYLTKPVAPHVFHSVLSAAVRDAQQSRTLKDELGRHKTSFNLIETCKFSFRTLTDAESLAAFAANCFPDPQRALPGLGELLVNAVEHGILRIGYERKTSLVHDGIWRSEIDRMLAMPDRQDKTADMTLARKPDGVYVIVTDPGEGFSWRQYMHIDPTRAGDNHGRGIAQANAISFDKLTYNEAGNQAVAFMGHQQPLAW